VAKYRPVHAEVDARQYTGEGNNGPTLAAWVNSFAGQKAMWWESRGYQDNGVSFQLEASFTLIGDEDSWDEVANPGDWIVEKDGRFKIYTDVDFKESFEKA
jgi:hypothetical protein